MTALYIHVPFCQRRCAYCGFYSTTHAELQDAYVAALLREMAARPCADEIGTVYLGGGTPSQLGEERLGRILSRARVYYNICADAEVTVEVNPDDVTPSLVSALREAGVNRVSMGIQSFDDGELHAVGRRHTAEEACRAVETLSRGGISNISIDLMYGLPGQTLESFARSIDAALRLPVQHISSYALSVEPGTPLAARLQSGSFVEASDEQMLAMYTLLRERLTAAGYEHYEISNFARPGYASRHNSSYWDGTPYIGLGPGAHGYDGHHTRRANAPDLRAYIAAPDDAPHTLEHLTPDALYDELVFTRLRTRRGLSVAEVPADRRDYLLHMAAPHIVSGRLTLTDNVLRLTPAALFISDGVMSDLMAEEE